MASNERAVIYTWVKIDKEYPPPLNREVEVLWSSGLVELKSFDKFDTGAWYYRAILGWRPQADEYPDPAA